MELSMLYVILSFLHRLRQKIVLLRRVTLITPVDKSERKHKFLLSEKLNLAKYLGQFLPKKICTSTKNNLNHAPWKSQF